MKPRITELTFKAGEDETLITMTNDPFDGYVYVTIDIDDSVSVKMDKPEAIEILTAFLEMLKGE